MENRRGYFNTGTNTKLNIVVGIIFGLIFFTVGLLVLLKVIKLEVDESLRVMFGALLLVYGIFRWIKVFLIIKNS